MIEIKNITKDFGKIHALTDINFTLHCGKTTALVGENGAGKSTLMRIMCGYISPTHGQTLIFGHDIQTNRLKALSYIGYVPEISSLYDDMTVYDFLNWIAQIRGIKQVEKTIITTAQKMQIIDVLEQKNATLSKGYKKRVEIASALLHQPKILILDEPTDGLDPNQKFELRQLIKQYAAENIVLISTHVLEDADIADNILMLSKGHIIYNNSIADFKKQSHASDLNEAFRILSKKKGELK